MLPIPHYFTTENAQGLQIVGDYTLATNPKGWVILQHGFSSSRATSLQTQAARLACLAAKYSVIQFDTTHSFGASEGALEHCTAHTAYADLCAVINWVKAQTFCNSQKFVLAGVSLGGLCVGHYAEENPTDVRGLILMCTVMSGKLNHEAHLKHDSLSFEAHRNTGFIEKTSSANQKKKGRISWAYRERLLDFDLVANANKINCPTLLVAGSNDTSTLVQHHQIMAEALGQKAQLHVIDGAPHSIKDMAQLQELHNIIKTWLIALR